MKYCTHHTLIRTYRLCVLYLHNVYDAKVLYTGDFSREEDRHLMAAEIPSVIPDVMIMEATFGTHNHEKREDREARFTSTVHDIVTRGGRCLIPVFALGRAQELLLILGTYVYVRMCACMHLCTNTYMCMYICIHVCIYVRTVCTTYLYVCMYALCCRYM